MFRRVGPILIALATIAATGCTDDDASLIILHNQAPRPECDTSPSLTDDVRSSGVIDTSASVGYIFTPLIQNTATSMMGSSNTSQRNAIVEGANISLGLQPGVLSDSAVASLQESNLLNFSQAFRFTVFPDNSLFAASFVILPTALLDQLAPSLSGIGGINVTATIELFGKIGGGDLRSQEFAYPMFVCNGCLVNDLGPCDAVPQGTVVNTGGECQALQDPVKDPFTADCCTRDGALTCPAVPLGPST